MRRRKERMKKILLAGLLSALVVNSVPGAAYGAALMAEPEAVAETVPAAEAEAVAAAEAAEPVEPAGTSPEAAAGEAGVISWNTVSALPVSSGNYKLVTDVTLGSTWTIDSGKKSPWILTAIR